MMRNSIKALLVRNGKILFIEKHENDTGEAYYTLPGGGQEFGETFPQTLRRECAEELGADIEVRGLAFIYEYIGSSHALAYKHSHLHQISHVFHCELVTQPDISRATETDDNQTGYIWIPAGELKNYNVYPKALKEKFTPNGEVIPPVYMGNPE